MSIWSKKFPLFRRGFTLAELLVAAFVVVLLLVGAFSILRFGIFAQRSGTERQVLLDQVSFASEHMSRQLRYAEWGTSSCTGGDYYEIVGVGQSEVRFLNAAGECVRLYLNGATGAIEEVKNSGTPRVLTSGNIQVAQLRFAKGNAPTDTKQPRLTFSILARSASGSEHLIVQHTVSQRKLNK